jgi:hypothetical protein
MQHPVARLVFGLDQALAGHATKGITDGFSGCGVFAGEIGMGEAVPEGKRYQARQKWVFHEKKPPCSIILMSVKKRIVLGIVLGVQ